MPKILVIEDEAPLLEEILEILDLEGFDVIGAPDGAKGLQLAKSEMPDLIVSDISMPELNGYEVLEAIRDDADTYALPVIFLTARVDKSFMRHGMELGADDYLTKPFTNGELISAVRARLERHERVKGTYEAEVERVQKMLSMLVAHELRTPLTSIVAVQDIIQRQLVELNDGQLSDLLTVAQAGSKRLTRLVDQFVTLVQIESGLISMDKIQEYGEPVAIWYVINPAIELARRLAHRNHNLEVNTSEQNIDATVLCSIMTLKHAFAELLANAMDWSEEDGQVRLMYTQQDDWVVVKIFDHGPGIPDGVLERVSQGRIVTIEEADFQQNGVGLGMLLASKIIEAHNGRLEFDSNAKDGTVVTIKLPVTDISEEDDEVSVESDTAG